MKIFRHILLTLASQQFCRMRLIPAESDGECRNSRRFPRKSKVNVPYCRLIAATALLTLTFSIMSCYPVLDIKDSVETTQFFKAIAAGEMAEYPRTVDTIRLPARPVAEVGLTGTMVFRLKNTTTGKVLENETWRGYTGTTFVYLDPLPPGNYTAELLQDEKVVLSKAFRVIKQ